MVQWSYYEGSPSFKASANWFKGINLIGDHLGSSFDREQAWSSSELHSSHGYKACLQSSTVELFLKNMERRVCVCEWEGGGILSWASALVFGLRRHHHRIATESLNPHPNQMLPDQVVIGELRSQSCWNLFLFSTGCCQIVLSPATWSHWLWHSPPVSWCLHDIYIYSIGTHSAIMAKLAECIRTRHVKRSSL